jgi:tetratricopeptide (TPR) repeat protein
MKQSIKHISRVILFFAFTAVNADNHNELMLQANDAYIDENYFEAIEFYEQVRQMQLESSTLYYNLGNAYYQTGQRGMAILNYERALRLSPNDESIRHNLRIVREEFPERQEQMPQLFFLEWKDHFVQLLPVDGWAITIVLLAFAISFSIGVFFVIRSPVYKKTVFVVGLVLIAALFISIYSVNRQYYSKYVKQEAVVMSPRVTAKSAPGERGIDVFVVYEGFKVEISSELMNWYEVRLPNGNVGWLKSDAVEII